VTPSNLEVTQRYYAAWNARDTEALREVLDAACVAHTASDWPEPGPYYGRDAMLRWYEQLRGTWDNDSLEVLETRDAGDRIVTRQIWHGFGHGPDAGMEFSTVMTYRAGRIILLEFFWQYADALAAIGLSE
jgi:ketosteroid isomerase-like protein